MSIKCDANIIYQKCLRLNTRNKSGTTKRLASQCNLILPPWYKSILTSTIQQKQMICVRLIHQVPEMIDYIPVGQQIHTFFGAILNENPTSPETLGKYTGLPEAGILGLLYILEEHDNVCVFVGLATMINILMSSYDVCAEDLILPWNLMGIMMLRMRKYHFRLMI